MAIYKKKPGKKGYEFLNENIYENKQFIEAVQKNTPEVPVLLSYPTTTPSLAGKSFWYRGNLWHYMTENQLVSIGWNGLVDVGFPAPVSKNVNTFVYFTGDIDVSFVGNTFGSFYVNIIADFKLSWANKEITLDVLGLGDPTKATTITAPWTSFFGGSPTIFLTVINSSVRLLTNLENQGTSAAVQFNNTELSDTAIDAFFTELPPTIKTATINVQNNPGSGTCDPTIATLKGYIVVT